MVFVRNRRRDHELIYFHVTLADIFLLDLGLMELPLVLTVVKHDS